MKMSNEYTEYRLTNEEYHTLMEALQYAEENAVHSDGELQFTHTKRQLIKQSDHHAQDKSTESERFDE